MNFLIIMHIIISVMVFTIALGLAALFYEDRNSILPDERRATPGRVKKCLIVALLAPVWPLIIIIYVYNMIQWTRKEDE